MVVVSMAFDLHLHFNAFPSVWDDPTTEEPAVLNPVESILASLAFYGEDVPANLALLSMVGRAAQTSEQANMRFDLKHHPTTSGHRYCAHAKAVRHPTLQAAAEEWRAASCGHSAHLQKAMGKSNLPTERLVACAAFWGNLALLETCFNAIHAYPLPLVTAALGGSLANGQTDVVGWLLRRCPESAVVLQKPIQSFVRVVDGPVLPISLACTFSASLLGLLADAVGETNLTTGGLPSAHSPELARPLINAIRSRQLKNIQKMINLGLCPPLNESHRESSKSIYAALAISDDASRILKMLSPQGLNRTVLYRHALVAQNITLVEELTPEAPADEVRNVPWRMLLWTFFPPHGTSESPSRHLTRGRPESEYLPLSHQGRNLLEAIIDDAMGPGSVKEHARRYGPLVVYFARRYPSIASSVFCSAVRKSCDGYSLIPYLRLLVEGGVDPNCKDVSGETMAVHFVGLLRDDSLAYWAASKLLPAAVELGADFSALDDNGDTPFKRAVKDAGAKDAETRMTAALHDALKDQLHLVPVILGRRS